MKLEDVTERDYKRAWENFLNWSINHATGGGFTDIHMSKLAKS